MYRLIPRKEQFMPPIDKYNRYYSNDAITQYNGLISGQLLIEPEMKCGEG